MGKRTIIIIASIVAIVGAVVFRLVMNNSNSEKTSNSKRECFKVIDNKIEGYYYNLCGKDVVIPSNINGKPVNVIGESVFENMNINSIKLPDTLTKIEQYAFNKNNIESVVIPASVTYIGKNAFSNNKISSLEIKAEKMGMGETPFNNNQLDDKNAFIFDRTYGIDKTTIVSYAGKNRNSVKIPSGVTNIGQYAFSDMGIKKVTLNKELNIIGNGAFVGNNFEEITIPSSVTFFGDNAFNYDIKRIVIENKNSKEDFGYYGMQTFTDEILSFEGKTKKTEKEIQMEKAEEGIIQ